MQTVKRITMQVDTSLLAQQSMKQHMRQARLRNSYDAESVLNFLVTEPRCVIICFILCKHSEIAMKQFSGEAFRLQSMKRIMMQACPRKL